MWKKEDFKGKLTSFYTSNIMQTLASDGGGLHLSGWLANLYNEYCFGPWNKKLPDPVDLQDQQMLGSYKGEEHCVYHKRHPKFGPSIVETGATGVLNSFSFFDYAMLQPLFDALDKYPAVDLPYVPTYYAKPEDRLDYNWFVERGLI